MSDPLLPPLADHEIPEGADPATYGRSADAPMPAPQPVPPPPDIAVPLETDETPRQKETLSDLLRSVETSPYVPPQANQQDVIQQMQAMKASYESEIKILQDAAKQIATNIAAKTALLKGCDAFLSEFEGPKPVKKKAPPVRKRKTKAVSAAAPDPVEASGSAAGSSPPESAESSPEPDAR